MADEEEVAVAAVETEKKAKKKKNKNKKSGRAHHDQQEIAKAAAMPGDVEEEKVGAKTRQEDVEVKGSASLLSLYRPDPESDDGQNFYEVEEEEEEGEEEEKEEEEEPDEDFLLEGASSTLICPISLMQLTSAVVAKDTYSYQEEALEKWEEPCQSQGLPLTSPMTSAPMEPPTTINQTVRVLVREHIEARKQAWRQMRAEKNVVGGWGR